MLTVSVYLAASMLCFDGRCYAALLGDATPLGVFPLHLQATAQANYGGDVLLFHETEQAWFAVHRTWPGREQLYARPPGDRRRVTNGCVNLEPAVYERLRTRLAVAGGAMLTIRGGRPPRSTRSRIRLAYVDPRLMGWR